MPSPSSLGAPLGEPIDLCGRKVLVVDDTPANIDVLRRALVSEGYAIYVATSGKRALRVAAAAKPDLVLLDVMMPEMDGFETCRRLHEAEATRNIPVIFVTARTAPEDAVAGFRAGAVDYVAKPIQLEEVCARVRAHLSLRVLAEERERANESVRRLAYATGKSEVAASVLHNIGNALTAMSISAESLREHAEKSVPGVGRADTLDSVRHDAAALMREIGAVQHILVQLGEYGKPVGFAQKTVLRSVIEVAFDLALGSLDVASVNREIVVPDTLTLVSDGAKLTHLLVLLLKNAIEACAQVGHGEGVVTVSAAELDADVEVRVRDNGPGISEDEAARVFRPGYSTKGEERGFGLHWCQIAAGDLSGSLRVCAPGKPGGELVLRLPKLAAPRPAHPSPTPLPSRHPAADSSSGCARIR